MRVAVYRNIDTFEIRLLPIGVPGNIGYTFLRNVELPELVETKVNVGEGVFDAWDKAKEMMGEKPKDNVFPHFSIEVGSNDDLNEAYAKGRLFHTDEYHKYFEYKGKLYVTDNQFAPKQKYVRMEPELVEKVITDHFSSPIKNGGIPVEKVVQFVLPICALDVKCSYKIKE